MAGTPEAHDQRLARRSAAPARMDRWYGALRWWRVVRPLLTTIAIVLAGRTLWQQWSAVRQQPLSPRLGVGRIVAASLLVLLAYLILIESWRIVLRVWGARLGWLPAARIWSVSNLGRYVPGKIWQITAMGAMLQRRGVSVVVAGGAAIVITVANVLAGFALVFILGANALTLPVLMRRATLVAVVVLSAALVTSPLIVPTLSRMAPRLAERLGNGFAVPRVAPLVSVVGSLAAWVLYGAAFRVFSTGLVGRVGGSPGAFVAVYAASYLLGYLAVFAPGGIGVRELALATALPAFGLATAPEAALITVASRLWLTVLEVVPAVVFLALQPGREA